MLYQREFYTEVKGEIALWRAVITQALMDASSQSNKMEARYEKSKSLCWLTGYSEDFKTVCDLADLPPDYVRSRAKKALARNCKWRQEYCHPPVPEMEQDDLEEV